MRIVTSLALVAIVLTLPLSAIAAPSPQATVDIKALALTKADLPRGFEIVPERTVTEDRPDGVAVYDVTFARDRTPENLAAGPFEVRSGVARTAKAADAMQQLDSTRDAFLAEGWTEAPVPALGEETLGLTQTTDGDGGQIAHYSYLFRKDTLIMMIGVRGRPQATKMEDAVGYAIKISGRVDGALGGTPPAASAGQPARAGSTGAERVRVINADGGSVNMRAEPSTSADVAAQVAEGTVLDIAGPNRDAEGRTWRNVKLADGGTGWIASTFLESVAAPPPPPPPPAASPAASPAAGPARTGAAAPAATPEPTDEPPASATPSPAPSASTTPTTEASGSGAAIRGSGNGLTIEGTIRDANLSSGSQLVKVQVLRNGGPVSDAIVHITARLDANRFRSEQAPRTNGDGRTELEWPMEGPPGTYEVVVDVRTNVTGPVTTAKGSFRWR